MMQYTSELAAKAMGLSPKGTPHAGEPCVCAMCQRAICPGDLSELKNLTRTFMDFQHLARSDYLCGFCAATIGQTVMRELQRSVITGEGIYNLNTDDARAWFWLTPPAPPYAVVINHNTMGAFHYFWRTPVTLDNRVVYINVDGTVYQVQRERILKALEHSKTLLAIISSLPAKGKRKAMNSPFGVLSRDPGTKARANHGRLVKEVADLAKTHPQCIEAIRYLDTLGTGELIALSPMLKQKPAIPTQPEIIRSFTK